MSGYQYSFAFDHLLSIIRQVMGCCESPNPRPPQSPTTVNTLSMQRKPSSKPEFMGRTERPKKSPSNQHRWGDVLYVQRKYILDEHPQAFHLTLRLKGEDWEKEFASVGDAVAYAGSLPDSEGATLAVISSSGGQLVELRVKDEVLSS